LAGCFQISLGSVEEGELTVSLIENLMENCTLLNRVRRNDGYGGYTETWEDGATFKATIIKNSTTEATLAERQGASEIFTIVVPKGFSLDFHDVLRRESDGSVFRVTSLTKDSEAPEQSTVKISKVTAERWVIPAE